VLPTVQCVCQNRAPWVTKWLVLSGICEWGVNWSGDWRLLRGLRSRRWITLICVLWLSPIGVVPNFGGSESPGFSWSGFCWSCNQGWPVLGVNVLLKSTESVCDSVWAQMGAPSLREGLVPILEWMQVSTALGNSLTLW